MNSKGQSLIYEFNTGKIEEINKEKYVDLMISLKITSMKKEDLMKLSYADIIKLHKNNLQEIEKNIFIFTEKINRIVITCLIDKTFEDFRKYCRKWLLQDENILYKCDVYTGQRLTNLVKKEIGLTPRWFTNNLLSYIKTNNKLCAIYGVRRTGKTYSIYHCINELFKNTNNNIAYITFDEDTNLTMSNLIDDIKLLQANNYNYIFVDEITFISDFFKSANLLSDTYASISKLVISGTNSFALALSKLHVLFGDRIKFFNSTFMSYKEFAEVAPYGKDKTSFNNYLRIGGIFDISKDYIEEHTDKDDTLESYVNDSISTNIAKSIQKYIPYDRTRNIPDEIETLAKDFTSLKTAIEKIIDRQSKQFLLDILNNEYKLINELNFINKWENEDVRQINIIEIAKRFKEKLKIDETKQYSQEVLIYLKECLWKLGILKEYEYYLDDSLQKRYVLSQPALRGYQIQCLVDELMADPAYIKLGQDWKTKVKRNLYRYIKGFLAEQAVLNNVLNIKNTEKIHVYQYHCSMKGGEIDMILYDENKCCMKMFEIKHIQGNIQKDWYHYLLGETGIVLNKAKQMITKNIIGKYVLCWQNSNINDEIKAITIEDYLKNMTQDNLV